MQCCKNRHDAVCDLLPPMQEPISSLENVLNDRLASIMLLKFSETELSSENVQFLLEVHELNVFISLKAKLKRMLTRRTSARGSDGRRTDRRSTEGSGIGKFHHNRAIDMTRSIIKRHVANNNLCLTEHIGGALRKWLREQEPSPSIPFALITKAYEMTLRTVKHDIFPRFISSSLAQELLYVHLGRTLQHEALKSDFSRSLQSPHEQAALAFWEDVRTFGEVSFSSSKAWTAAAELMKRHGDTLLELCPEEHARIKLALVAAGENADGPPPNLFGGAKTAMQNLLTEPYVRFVSEESSSKRHLAELGLPQSLQLSDRPSAVTATHQLESAQSTASAAEMDYADGW